MLQQSVRYCFDADSLLANREGFSVRKALVRAMSISVRFSTPLSLYTLQVFDHCVGLGVADEKDKLVGYFSANAFVFAASVVMWKVVSPALTPVSRYF